MKLIYIPLCFYLYLSGFLNDIVKTHLHSTMFLLIRRIRAVERGILLIYIPLCFYLYQHEQTKLWEINDLHSTMFLLIHGHIRSLRGSARFTFHYVSTYTALFRYFHSDRHTFTFHYVSTYTIFRPNLFRHHPNLHSTMFLLIQTLRGRESSEKRIYIPLCFYLYHPRFYKSLKDYRFTFHYVSTYTIHGFINH